MATATRHVEISENFLHINYEENLDSDDVERSIRDAKTLVAEMRTVISNGGIADPNGLGLS